MEDFFLLALTNFSHRKKRTFLTLVGIFVGIAATVALVALGGGLQATVAREFQKIGSDKINVMSLFGDIPSPFASASSANPITESDAELVGKVRGVKDVAAAIILIERGEFAGAIRSLSVVGMPTGEGKRLYEETTGLEVERGRLLKSPDYYSAFIGKFVADDAFPRKIGVGDSIEIAGRGFKVVGIAKSLGDPGRDSRVFIPRDAGRELLGKPEIVSMIIAQSEPGVAPAEVAKEISRKLRAKRGQKEGEEDFAVATFEQFLNSLSAIFGVLQAVLVGIASISLLVGGVGIMNTMFTSVVERTREIGIMKAVGARNSDVAAVFLIESGLLGAVGGLIGIILGVCLALVAEFAASQALGSGIFKAAFSIELLAGALLFSFFVGAFSGLFPAMRASSLKPVEAINQ